MVEYNSGEEVSYNADEASVSVKECIEGIIGGIDYNQNKVNQWTASIVEHSLTQLYDSTHTTVSYNADEASVSVKECIEGIIGGIDYNQNKVNQWTASIVEHSLTQLVKQGRPFKFIGWTMGPFGAGLHTANSCYWDTATDGSCTVRWENRTMYCVVCVFAVAVTC
ncbi:dynein light chain Tctex-type 3-like [Salvelinus alpinus]